MAALPYMQLYVADYLSDTAHLTTLEHGAYLLLIFNYWQRGESFRANDERSLNRRLATVARMSNEEWDSVRNALAEFFEITENEWVHLRIEHDLEAVRIKSQRAAIGGKASGNARSKGKRKKNERTLNKRSANVQQTLNHTDTDTDTDKHPPTPSKGDAHSTFDAFWKAYPKKVERKGALAIWTRRKLDKLSDKIIADVERRITDDELWRQGYIPHPTTYLNGDRWEDQYGKAGEAQAKPEWMTGGWE